MMKRRIAILIAGALVASQAAVAANYGPSPYQGSDQNPPPQGTQYPTYSYRVPNVIHAPMASESSDNPAYNASAQPDNFPWFGNELLGQRPNPTQWRYFKQREAQFAQRPVGGTAICYDSANRPFYC
jgi:hypothetical protein